MNAINDMGSRLIISSTGNDMFEPDRYITTADFTQIVIKALSKTYISFLFNTGIKYTVVL